jgi:hypothetical protein
MKRELARKLTVLAAIAFACSIDPEPVQAPAGRATDKPPPARPQLLSASTAVGPEHLPLLFARDRDSAVARFVGSAEGTRMPDGSYTTHYKGHVDPGNQVWNLGSFSYQNHPEKPLARTAIEADRVQSEVLRLQALELLSQARRRGLSLSLAELANGIDLANQSPAAACVTQPDRKVLYQLAAGKDRSANTARVARSFNLNKCQWGYVDRLKQARAVKGLSGMEAVLEARTWSYFQVDRQSYRFNSWDAAAFGHSPERIRADQSRRAQAIAEALAAVLSERT